jgi:hypothetical protein
VRVAFEIDHVDYTFRRGWSVMARGTTTIADDPDEVARLPWGWEPKPWAGGDRPLLVTLPLTELTGRRLGAGWNPMSELPGRRAWSQPLPRPRSPREPTSAPGSTRDVVATMRGTTEGVVL